MYFDHLLLLLRPREGCEVFQSLCLHVCLSVFLSVRWHISKTTFSNFTKFSAHATCGRGSVLLSRQCSMLRTSGFVDDVMFSDNRPNRDTGMESATY